MRASRPLPAPARLTFGDLVRTSLPAIVGRPLRTVLSALGIALGIAAMVAVVAISTSSQAWLEAQIRRVGTDMLTVRPGQTIFGENAQLPVESPGRVGRIDGVRAVTAIGTVPNVTVRRTDRIPPAESGGIGVYAARLDLLGTVGGAVRSGVFLNQATGRYPAVVLGSVSARRLGVDAAGPDVRVYLGGRWFTVIGVLNSITLAPELDRGALVGWSVAQSLLRFDGHPTTLYTRSVDERVAAVRDLLAPTVDPEHPEQLDVSRPSDALTAQLAAKTTFNGLFVGLGAVALLVGGVGVGNIMVISVLERRREIGVRRALGAGRGQIRLQFLTESVMISVLGGLAGVLLGLGIAITTAVVRDWPVVLPAQAITGGTVAAIAVGTVAGLYPARRAARTSPTEALATA